LPSFVVIDLGQDSVPLDVSDSGYVLLWDGDTLIRWKQGSTQELQLNGGLSLTSGEYITESGLVVANTGSDGDYYETPVFWGPAAITPQPVSTPIQGAPGDEVASIVMDVSPTGDCVVWTVITTPYTWPLHCGYDYTHLSPSVSNPSWGELSYYESCFNGNTEENSYSGNSILVSSLNDAGDFVGENYSAAADAFFFVMNGTPVFLFEPHMINNNRVTVGISDDALEDLMIHDEWGERSLMEPGTIWDGWISGISSPLDGLEEIVAGADYFKRMTQRDPDGNPTNLPSPDFHRAKLDWLVSNNSNWSDLCATAMSPNGTIVGEGIFTDPETGVPELRGVLLLKVDLVPDWDRNGVIDQADRGKVTESDPFRFWINDDDDSGEWDIDDVPQRGNDADAKDLQVDGLRDLVDFFPLYFDLEDFLGSFDDLSTVDLKLSGSSLSFIQYPANFDGIEPSDSWKYLRDLTFARDNLADATTVKVSDDPANPTSLGADFVTLASEGKGVLLLEGVDASQATAPPVLHAFFNGTEIFTYEFPLRLSDVEDMYHHRNLQGIVKNYDGSDEVASIVGEPSRSTAPNWPDELSNGKYFVYLHGFKVDGQRARGEHAEAFKRLHQMGSNTRFVGVTWHGTVDPDYHKGVYQAFETGEALNSELGLNGDITVMAHSLGNVVVSNAIQNGGFLPDRYFMVNAAVATEAYGFSAVEQDMVEENWDSIPHRLHAAEWHKVFEGTTGARKNLKWRNYFAGVLQSTTVVNFHSPGEDVLAHMTGLKTESVYNRIWTWNWNLARGAWKAQELVKGKSWLSTGGESLLFERTQSGWNRNLLAYLPGFTNWANVTDEDIKTTPVFDRFIEDDLTDADSAVAHAKASEKKVEYDLLARAIPALSYAAAIDPIGGGFITDWDMETKGRAPGLNGEWPVEGHTKDIGQDLGRWLHSDFRANALHFVYPMYEEMIIQGGMNDD